MIDATRGITLPLTRDEADVLMATLGFLRMCQEKEEGKPIEPGLIEAKLDAALRGNL